MNPLSPIRGWLRPYPDAGKVRLEEVLDEGGLAGGVLPDEHDHGPRVEVGVLQDGGVEVVELVLLLEREQLLPVEGHSKEGLDSKDKGTFCCLDCNLGLGKMDIFES